MTTSTDLKDLHSAMPAAEILQELRAIIMFGMEETVLLGKVDMSQKDRLLVQMDTEWAKFCKSFNFLRCTNYDELMDNKH